MVCCKLTAREVEIWKIISTKLLRNYENKIFLNEMDCKFCCLFCWLSHILLQFSRINIINWSIKVFCNPVIYLAQPNACSRQYVMKYNASANKQLKFNGNNVSTMTNFMTNFLKSGIHFRLVCLSRFFILHYYMPCFYESSFLSRTDEFYFPSLHLHNKRRHSRQTS